VGRGSWVGEGGAVGVCWGLINPGLSTALDDLGKAESKHPPSGTEVGVPGGKSGNSGKKRMEMWITSCGPGAQRCCAPTCPD